jgi:SAM-dependent methyltransferase
MRERELLHLRDVPVYQNRMFERREDALACPRGDLRLVQNCDTGLVFNDAFDARLIEYGDDYQNEQAHSAAFRDHLEQAYAVIHRNLHGRSVAEIGCGKGYFLNLLNERGFAAVGVDPAYQGNSPLVMKRCFDRSLGLECGAIVLRHVLEHIPNPIAFLREILEANGGSGLVYIEVPSFDWIRDRRAWFDVFYEHVNYFRIDDLRRMFGTVLDAGHVFGGQYLYVVADLATLRDPHVSVLDKQSASLPADFFAGIDRCRQALAKGGRQVVWGAAAKGMMFSLHITNAGGRIDFAIDINPAKQGKFLAGSGVGVVSPEDGLQNLSFGDTIFVMNSVYLAEIVAQAGAGYNYIAVDHDD